LLRQDAEDRTALATLLSGLANNPPRARSHKEWTVQSTLIGARARAADRERRLAALAGLRESEAAKAPRLAQTVVALLGDRDGGWSGTATDLLALLPGIAADAIRLARLLVNAGADLAAAGVTVQRRREAGTGRRLLALRVGGVPSPLRARGPGEGVPPKIQAENGGGAMHPWREPWP